VAINTARGRGQQTRSPAQIEAEIRAIKTRQNKLKMRNLEREIEYAKKKASGEEDPWYEDFGEGIGKSALKLNTGLNELIGIDTPEQHAALADYTRDAGESGWGTAGEITGEILQLAIPGGALIKGAKGAQKARGLVNTMKAAATSTASKEAGLAGTLAAARLPEQGETRLKNAALDAGLGVAGALGGRALAKTLKGADKTPEAAKMIAEGIPLTPGQSASGGFVAGLEQAMDYIPIASKGGVNARKRALDKWNQNVLNKAAPDGTFIDLDELGTKGTKKLKNAMTAAYDDAWKGVGPLRRKHVVKMQENMRKNTLRLGEADERAMQAAWDDIEKLIIDGSRKGFKSADDLLRRRLKSAGSDKYDLTEALTKARADLRAQAPAEVLEKLAKADSVYPAYLTARNAVKRASKDGGVFTPDQLTTSVGAVGKAKSEVGDAALQAAADTGRETVGKSVSEPLPDLWRRIVRNAWTPDDAMDFGGRLIMGDTPGQQKMLKGLGALKESENPLAYILRNVADPARIAPSLNRDEEY
jgi:hypothetical protein